MLGFTISKLIGNTIDIIGQKVDLTILKAQSVSEILKTIFDTLCKNVFQPKNLTLLTHSSFPSTTFKQKQLN